MLFVNATDMRKEWSSFVDSIVRGKTKVIKKARDYIVIIQHPNFTVTVILGVGRNADFMQFSPAPKFWVSVTVSIFPVFVREILDISFVISIEYKMRAKISLNNRNDNCNNIMIIPQKVSVLNKIS